MLHTYKRFIFWSVVFLLPFFTAFFIQIPLCFIDVLSQFMRSLKPHIAMGVLTLVFIIPTYAWIIFANETRRSKLIATAIFTVSLFILVPVLWVFGFATARWLFATCQ